ncbi:MAG: HU family DNA-binding protein [Planctomycetota bacterium]
MAARSNITTVTKKDLIDRIAEATGQKRTDVKRSVQSFLDIVVDELGSGNRLEFRDFGVFEVREKSARVAQNPKTLERVEVPAKRSVKFKPGRLMRLAMEAEPVAADQAASAPAGRDASNDAPAAGELQVETRPIEPARPVQV